MSCHHQQDRNKGSKCSRLICSRWKVLMVCETPVPKEVSLFLTMGQRCSQCFRWSYLETNFFFFFFGKKGKINISVVAKEKHSHIYVKCDLIKMVSVTLKRGSLDCFLFVYLFSFFLACIALISSDQNWPEGKSFTKNLQFILCNGKEINYSLHRISR